MKKLLTFMLSGILALSLTACGGSTSTSDTNSSGSSAQPVDSKKENASTYPDKPISILAPSGAGGGLDLTARAVSKALSETKLVDQTIMVENKPGGGQSVGLADFINKQAKNDYALILPSSPIVINYLKKEGSSPYSFRDMTPIAQLTKDYAAIVVRTDSKYQDLKSLLDDMKANPEQITLAGGSSPGSMDHLTAILPAYKYGIDPNKIKYVSYDGGGEAMTALLGGNADVLSSDVSGVGEYLKAGKIRVLGVSSPERLSGQFQDIPTFIEQGIDAEFINWRGLFGPKDMSEEAVEYWQIKFEELSKTEEWKKTLEANGWENGFKKGEEFKAYLEKQEKLLQEMLTTLGMAK